MRNLFSMVLLAAGVAACASSSSSTGSGAAASPAEAAATVGEANPCALGDCRVTIQVEPEIADLLNERGLNFRFHSACPRSFGGTTANAVRTAPTFHQTRVSVVELPAFQGRSVTLSYWLGSSIDRITVIEFSQQKNVVVQSPYTAAPGGYTTDPTIRNLDQQKVGRCVA